MPLSAFSTHLAELAQADALRTRRVVASAQGPYLTVDGRDYLAFASNDYLGLANDARVVEAAQRAAAQYGLGAGASHMVSGHMTPHHDLESALARFMGMDSALYFGSGYAANLGILTSLAGRGDNIFADKLNHACLNDGALLSRANFKRYAHGDYAKLRTQLAFSGTSGSKGTRNLIVTDAVFSMDGDIADLPQLLKLAVEFDALLVIDDAHGFGVLGKTGRGALEHFNLFDHPARDRIVYMATLGKAAGVYGAFVAGHADVIEWILQSARTYIFSTATPPMIAAALLESLRIIGEDDERRTHLRSMIALFADGLKLKSARFPYSETAIQPIIVGDNVRALHMADQLKQRGIWVPAIRPPTVPAGSARLRVSLNAGHTQADVMDLMTALVDIDANLS